MHLMDYGKAAATFVDSVSGQAVRIHPNPQARERWREFAPDARTRWHGYLSAYQVMPVEALLVARPVQLTLSLEALISRPGVRVNCAGCGEEIINEREVYAGGKVLCRSCAGDGYYTGAAWVPQMVCEEAVAAGR